MSADGEAVRAIEERDAAVYAACREQGEGWCGEGEGLDAVGEGLKGGEDDACLRGCACCLLAGGGARATFGAGDRLLAGGGGGVCAEAGETDDADLAFCAADCGEGAVGRNGDAVQAAFYLEALVGGGEADEVLCAAGVCHACGGGVAEDVPEVKGAVVCAGGEEGAVGGPGACGGGAAVEVEGLDDGEGRGGVGGVDGVDPDGAVRGADGDGVWVGG